MSLTRRSMGSRRLRLFRGVVLLAAGVATISCQKRDGARTSDAKPAPTPEIAASAPAPELVQPTLKFSSVEQSSGVEFQYYGGPSEQHYMTEQNGGGVAIADFDNDERLDLFFVNGSSFAEPAQSPEHSNQLFRSIGPLRYEAVTQDAGLVQIGFGMGCAAADFDNDGFCDLFVSYYGPNRLYRNNGDGTFTEWDAFDAAADERWSTSAAFADLDDDGDLDLYVVNYVEWDEKAPPCFTEHKPPIRITCGPLGRPGQPDQLFENVGSGRFRDVGPEAGVALADGKGLALGIADFDGDRRLDVYVANDTTPNSLFQNQGGLRFADVGLEQGVATSAEGKAQAGMGVGCADYNGDGRLDLFVTNFENEVNDFYENLGPQGFLTRSAALGLDAVSRAALSFGVLMTDFDLDRRPDLFVANGHIWDLAQVGVGYEYEMRPHLFQNVQGERFAPVGETAGEYFSKKWLGRSAAVGDLDDDGDPDLVVTHLHAPPAILRNDSAIQNRRCRLHLIGRRSARQPLGVQVRVKAGDDWQTLLVPSGQSFQSTSDCRVLAPVATSASEIEIEVQWSHESRSRHRLAVEDDLVVVEPVATDS